MWLVERIEAENFMTFRKLDLTLSNRKGITLIEGRRHGSGRSNGAGKSSIFEAIHWCLYGEPIRKLRYVAKIKWRHASTKNPRVYVALTINLNGEEIVVERTRNGRDSTLNVFRGKEAIAKPKDDDTKVPIAGTQRLIDSLFGTQLEFTASAMFSGQTSRFCRMSDSERKELLERMAGATRFITAGAIAKRKLDLLLIDETRRVDFRRDQEAKVAGAVEGKSTITSNSVRSYVTNLTAYYEQLERVQAMAETMNGRADQLNDALHLGREAAEAAAARVADAEKLVDGAAADVEKFTAEVAKVKALKDAKDTQVSDVASEIKRLTANIHPETCPHCNQRWPNMDGKKTDDLVRARREYMDGLRKEADQLKGDLAQVRDTLRDAEERRRTLRSAAATLRVEADSKPEREALANFFTAQSALSAAMERLDEIASDVDPDAALSPDTTRYDATITEARSAIAGSLAESAVDDTMRRRLEFWKKGFARSAFPSFLLDSAIPRMNDVAGRIAADLSDGELTVRFNPAAARGAGDVFAVEAVYADGSDDYDTSSNGEHVRIDVPVLFAVRDFVESQGRNRCGQLFLDELFDGTDAAFSEAMMAMLRRHFPNKPIFIISHEDVVKSMCDDTIIVRKRRREAEIVAA